MQFPEGKWGCVVAMLNAASKGRKAAFCDKTVVCRGGKAGLGFQTLEKGTMEYFLSTGEKGPKAGEFYKKKSSACQKLYVRDTRTDFKGICGLCATQ